MLENPRSYVLLRVACALADRLGTDPATTVLNRSGLGFATKRLPAPPHDLSVAYATSLDTMKAAEHEGSGPAGFVRAALNRDMQNLHALSNSLNAGRLCLGQALI